MEEIKENKYSRGKIYKLVPKIINENEEQLIYIGSTTEKYLSNRLGKHKSQYKLYKIAKIKNKYTSYKLFDKYSIDNVDIILILEYPCQSKYELHAKEREYIEKNTCVNKYIPTRKLNEYFRKLSRESYSSRALGLCDTDT